VIGAPVLADIQLDAPTVLLQWAVGGLFFLWITTRRREVGLGYGWLLRGSYGLLALGALGIGLAFDTVPVRELGSAGVAAGALVALVVSVLRRKAGVRGQVEVEERRTARVEFPPALDLIAPAIGVIGLVAAGINAGDPAALSIARAIVGAAFLGAVTDAMLLGHWYLVQPGLPRAPILERVKWTAATWPAELLVLLWPTGMVSVLNGTIDDGYNGLLGWFWVASSLATIILVGVTRAALRERQYSAVMAATGLLYLAILMAFCMDLVARATLS
jgi:hypothetical protein